MTAPTRTRVPTNGSLPAPPAAPVRRGRNLPLIVAGALLLVIGCLTTGFLITNAGDRRAVLVVTRPVRAGGTLQDQDIGEAQVSADSSIRPIAASHRSQVVGRVAGVGLVPGTLLAEGHFATGPIVGEGLAAVGLSLRPGQYPPRLRALDRVQLVRASQQGTDRPETLNEQARVLTADYNEVGATVTVIVPVGQAATIAAAAASGQVGVVLLGGPS